MKQIAARLIRLEARRAASSPPRRIVLYDAATGVPLPGYAPPPDATGTTIWIPDNGRAAGGDDDARERGKGAGTCA